jgi:hypothetical protein
MQANKAPKAVIVSAMLFASAIIAHAAMLDGTKWKVKLVPDKATADKGAKAFDDELIFTNGEFTSKIMLREGFKPSKYKVETEPGEIGFEVEQFRATNDVAIWIGDTRGTNTIGGLQWKKKVHGDFIYEFNGTKE